MEKLILYMQSGILKNRSRVHRHSLGVQLILFYVDYCFIARKLSFDFELVIQFFWNFFLSRISRKSTDWNFLCFLVTRVILHRLIFKKSHFSGLLACWVHVTRVGTCPSWRGKPCRDLKKMGLKKMSEKWAPKNGTHPFFPSKKKKMG